MYLNRAAMDLTMRGGSRMRKMCLPVSLSSLGKEVGTSALAEILWILRSGEFNNETFKDLILDIYACEAVARYFVWQCIKSTCSEVLL